MYAYIDFVVSKPWVDQAYHANNTSQLWPLCHQGLQDPLHLLGRAMGQENDEDCWLKQPIQIAQDHLVVHMHFQLENEHDFCPKINRENNSNLILKFI